VTPAHCLAHRVNCLPERLELLAFDARLAGDRLRSQSAVRRAGGTPLPRVEGEKLEHHLTAFIQVIDAILSEYTNDSALIMPEATYQGLAHIREFCNDVHGANSRRCVERLQQKRYKALGELATPHLHLPTVVRCVTLRASS
jgi:hypothetical protein